MKTDYLFLLLGIPIVGVLIVAARQMLRASARVGMRDWAAVPPVRPNRRPTTPNRIKGMPDDLFRLMNAQIQAGVPYRQIQATLGRAGHPVSNSSICRYARRELAVARRKPLSTYLPME